MTFSRLVAAVLATTVIACGGSSSDTVAPPAEDLTPGQLVATSPTSTTGTAGAALAAAVSVKIATKSGRLLPNVPVSFRVTDGGGSVSPATATSDAQGIASATWTLGAPAGVQRLSASAADLPSVTFTATAAAGPPVSLSKLAGDEQTTWAGTAVAVAPSVKLVDAAGNPASDVAVTFAVASGGGAVSGASARTDANGVARPSAWTLGTKPGGNSLTVTAASLPAATFTATAVPGAPQTIVFAQRGPPELRVDDTVSLRVKMFDAFGNENVAATVTYTVSPAGIASIDPDGNMAVLQSGDLTVTASSGSASVDYSASVLGHPVGTEIAYRIGAAATIQSVTLTDNGIWSVAATDRAGLLTRRSLDGTLQAPPLTLESAATDYYVLAPKKSGNTALVVNTGALTAKYWFVDIARNQIIDTLSTNRWVQFGGIASDGRRAYLILDTGDMAIVDMAQRQVANLVPLGAGITTFRLLPGDTLAEARTTFGTIFEIDLKRERIARQYLSLYGQYSDYVYSHDGSLVFALDAPNWFIRIFGVNDNVQRRLIAMPSSGSFLALSPDDHMILTGGSAWLGDPEKGYREGPRYELSGPSKRVIFSSSGSFAIVVSENGWIDVLR